jgi:hypothetical protein
MSDFMIAGIVFACTVAGALLGLWLRGVLPHTHTSSESMDAVKLATGLLATLAALVLGLLVSSSKGSLDAVNRELVQNAARVLQLDQILKAYGPAADDLRQHMLSDYRLTIQLLGEQEPMMVEQAYLQSRLAHMQDYQSEIAQLPAVDDVHRQLRAQAVQLQAEVAGTRWLLVLQRNGSLSMPLLVVLVVWLVVIFTSFGLLSPRNRVVLTAFVLCALSASGAILMILEMDRPLDGLVHVSLTPLQDALQRLTR